MMDIVKITPAFSEKNVPIFFSCDNHYVGFLAVAMVSLLEHISSNNNYDIIILEDGMDIYSKQFFTTLVAKRTNCLVRFFAMGEIINKHNVTAWNRLQKITVATYYRLFIPTIAQGYTKAIYLDVDILVQVDIAKLYSINIEDYCLGAVIDPNSEIGENENISAHLCNDLGLKTMDNYFNSGILLLNVKKMQEEKMLITMVNIAEKSFGYFADQDVLNVACQDVTSFLDPLWNVFWGLTFERYKMRKYDDKTISTLLDNAYIVHYAGEKPLERLNESYGRKWWYYARKTPFYESLLLRSKAYNLKRITT